MPVRKRRSRLSKASIEPADTNGHRDSLLTMTDSSALAGSLLTSRSESKRVSLPYQSDSQETAMDDESDDEVDNADERNEIREKKVTEKMKLAQIQNQKVDKDKGLIIHKLSADQLEQHYSQCIHLFSKNKVNVKNAFKLQLIDFMKLMMERKTDKSENLVLMSCTLDASAKIYSCRVDNVYTNLIKFVKSYQTGGKSEASKDKDRSDSPDNQHDSSDDSSDKEEQLTGNKAKKKDRKKPSRSTRASFVKEPTSLNRKDIETCYYRQHLPKNQTYFLESATLDEGCQLATNRPLFAKFSPETQVSTSYFTIDGAPLVGHTDDDNFNEKIPRYSELRSRIFLADDGPEDEPVELGKGDDNLTFDPDIENIAEMRNFTEISDGHSEMGDDPMDGDVEMDYDDCDIGPGTTDERHSVFDDKGATDSSIHAASSSSALSDLAVSAPRVSFTPVAMSRMLRSSGSKQSDYSYFDDSKLAFMPSATHWKIKPSKRTMSSVGKTPSKRGKASYLDFTSDEQIRHSIETILEEDGQTHKLSIKTTKDWFLKKIQIIFPPIIPGVRKQLLSLFKDPDTCILKVTRGADSEDQLYNANDSVLLNPVDFGAHTTDDGANDLGGDYHPLEDWRESMDDDDRVDNIEPITNEIVTENGDVVTDEQSGADLVPQPFRVEKVAVKFAKVQKKIDIKKLKNAIWNLMDLENNSGENKENLKNNDSVCGKKKEVVYSEIFNRLPHSISKEAAAQLSYPIAFMAVLHMANEKNLRLIGDGHHSDFTVSLDTST